MNELKDEGFTEEEAAEKLQQLGFEILDVADLQLIGWQIVDRRDTFGDWAVEQIDYDSNGDRELRMTLLTKFNSPIEAGAALIAWLYKGNF